MRSKGFTLVAALLIMLLLSAVAIGLLMMVNTEGKVGGTDLQNNLAYHAAEGGIEKMSSDLAAVFQNAQSPTSADICSAGGPSTARWRRRGLAGATRCCASPRSKSPCRSHRSHKARLCFAVRPFFCSVAVATARVSS